MDATPPEVGSYVRIHGLTAAPEHNDTRGFVTSEEGDIGAEWWLRTATAL